MNIQPPATGNAYRIAPSVKILNDGDVVFGPNSRLTVTGFGYAVEFGGDSPMQLVTRIGRDRQPDAFDGTPDAIREVLAVERAFVDGQLVRA